LRASPGSIPRGPGLRCLPTRYTFVPKCQQLLFENGIPSPVDVIGRHACLLHPRATQAVIDLLFSVLFPLDSAATKAPRPHAADASFRVRHSGLRVEQSRQPTRKPHVPPFTCTATSRTSKLKPRGGSSFSIRLALFWTRLSFGDVLPPAGITCSCYGHRSPCVRSPPFLPPYPHASNMCTSTLTQGQLYSKNVVPLAASPEQIGRSPEAGRSPRL